jgi:hypothetical protein
MRLTDAPDATVRSDPVPVTMRLVDVDDSDWLDIVTAKAGSALVIVSKRPLRPPAKPVTVWAAPMVSSLPYEVLPKDTSLIVPGLVTVEPALKATAPWTSSELPLPELLMTIPLAAALLPVRLISIAEPVSRVVSPFTVRLASEPVKLPVELLTLSDWSEPVFSPLPATRARPV